MVGRLGRLSAAILAVGAMGIEAGCVRTDWPRGEWGRAGGTREERMRDEYECERQAITSRRPDQPPAPIFAACMHARGYERVR